MNDDQPTLLVSRLENIYSDIFKLKNGDAEKRLKNYVTPKSDIERRRQRASTGNGFVSGMALIFFLVFLQTLVHPFIEYSNSCVYYKWEAEIKIVRVYFGLTFYAICLGLTTFIFEQRKINYIFILELPPSKVTASYRTHLRICMAFLLFLSVCCNEAILKMWGQTGIFSGGDLRYFLAQKLPVWLWLTLPALPLLFQLFRIHWNLYKQHSLVGKFVLNMLWKQLAPWKHRVSFPVFYVGDQLTSINQLLVDFFQAISRGKVPDYVIVAIVSAPSLVRAAQCLKRFFERRQTYPHIWNMAKFLSAIPGGLADLNAVKMNKSASRAVSCLRLAESLYKLYWDYVEDWALFGGGLGAREFRGQPEKWLNRVICRRPSSFSVTGLACACTFDLFARFQWGFNLFIRESGQQWFKTFCMLLEITRRCVWNVLRVDNQQATNCEGYALTRFIPVLVTQEQRLAEKQSETTDTKEDPSSQQQVGVGFLRVI